MQPVKRACRSPLPFLLQIGYINIDFQRFKYVLICLLRNWFNEDLMKALKVGMGQTSGTPESPLSNVRVKPSRLKDIGANRWNRSCWNWSPATSTSCPWNSPIKSNLTHTYSKLSTAPNDGFLQRLVFQ